MIKIEIKEGENIERALKRYKRKHRNVQIMQNLRESRYFTKPSVKRMCSFLERETAPRCSGMHVTSYVVSLGNPFGNHLESYVVYIMM